MKYIFLILLIGALSCRRQEYTTIIRGATMYDGSGNPGIVTDIAIRGDTIAAIGDLSGAISKHEINARGLAVAPGFIDPHSHHDRGMFEDRKSVV